MSRWMQHWTSATLLWFVACLATELPTALRFALGGLALVIYLVGLASA